MQNIPETIQRLGIGKIAEKLSVPYTTVHYWVTTGKVPHWRSPAVVQAISAIELDDAPDSPAPQSVKRVTPKAIGGAA